ncbi:MAG: phytanoyl-CoA dioxygenase family protein [Planctomycetota bacterium]|nr:phytanoyl-CoA dioxygenase family protein [Planctomycetota bacterium]MDA1141140.1 phytanoyl-CoA dioxygenase family protein [Planctomycetota bacterium]
MTDEDRWYFLHNGFYRVPTLLPEDLIKRLNLVTDEHVEQKIEPIVWEPSDLGEGVVRRLSKILERDPAYMEAATHPIILDALEGVLGPNIELISNKHNHIMVRPGKSAVVPWHSGEEPWDVRLITALIYLQASTMENGCIRIVPGSHQRHFQHPRQPTYKSFHDSPFFFRSVPMPMPRGGVLLFNDCCFHGADVNHTDQSRRSMTLAYQSHDVHDIRKDEPEKFLVRGERAYVGHPFKKDG